MKVISIAADQERQMRNRMWNRIKNYTTTEKRKINILLT